MSFIEIVWSALFGLGVALFGFAWQTTVAGVNRKIVARLQKRYGPKWYQEFIDIFKLLSKRAVSHGWIFDFGVIMALGGIIATAMFMPVTNTLVAFDGYDNFFILVYLIAVGKKPFETYIAPAEIASGPMVEYGGKQLGMLFIMHEITVFIEVSLFVHLFLGGAENIVLYLVKYFAVYTFVNLISYVNGRFKIDQVVVFFYKWPLLLAIIQAFMAIYLGWVI